MSTGTIAAKHQASEGRPVASCAVRVQRSGSTARLEVVGELDYGAREDLDVAVSQALAERSTRALVVDLRAVEFMDCSTARWLVGLDESTHRAGVRLVVCVDDGPVLRLLELTRVDRRLGLVAHGAARAR
jgi:anti-anti-sigma factor